MSTKNAVLATIGVAAIGAAGYITYNHFSGGAEGDYSALDRMYITCYNGQCKHEFSMTMAELNEKRDKATGDIACPQCGSVETMWAYHCPHCDRNYPPVGHSGKPEKCPLCGVKLD